MRRPDPRQLDLFSGPTAAPSQTVAHGKETPVKSRSIDPDQLDDAQLLEAFRVSTLTNTDLLAAVIARRRPTGWQDAALHVWKRFFGFGHGATLC